MKVNRITVNHTGDDGTVDVLMTDSAGNDVSYRYSGEISTTVTANGNRFFRVEVAVTRKRDNAERNVSSGRFTN